MPRWSVCVVVAAGLMGLACGGMMPGTEVAGADVQSGQPYSLSFTATGEDVLWLKYDLSHSVPYRITGSLDIRDSAGWSERHAVDFTEDAGPIVGRGTRVTWGTTKAVINGRGIATGTVKVLALDFLKKGTVYEIQGNLVADNGTVLNAVRLKVTD